MTLKVSNDLYFPSKKTSSGSISSMHDHFCIKFQGKVTVQIKGSLSVLCEKRVSQNLMSKNVMISLLNLLTAEFALCFV